MLPAGREQEATVGGRDDCGRPPGEGRRVVASRRAPEEATARHPRDARRVDALDERVRDQRAAERLREQVNRRAAAVAEGEVTVRLPEQLPQEPDERPRRHGAAGGELRARLGQRLAGGRARGAVDAGVRLVEEVERLVEILERRGARERLRLAIEVLAGDGERRPFARRLARRARAAAREGEPAREDPDERSTRPQAGRHRASVPEWTALDNVVGPSACPGLPAPVRNLGEGPRAAPPAHSVAATTGLLCASIHFLERLARLPSLRPVARARPSFSAIFVRSWVFWRVGRSMGAQGYRGPGRRASAFAPTSPLGSSSGPSRPKAWTP